MTAQPSVSATDRRDCALYRFWVRHPVTGRTVLGYVGETARMPFVRLMEHVLAQPWADIIVRWEVDPVTYRGKDAVLAAEMTAIGRERPLYNVEGNRGNPDRIPPWQAVKQRQAREPGWQPPVHKPRVPHPRGGSRRPPLAVASQWRVQVRDVGRVCRWLAVLLLGGWITAVAASGPVATWYDGLAYGVALPVVVVCAPWAAMRRRMWRWLRRRSRRWLR